MRQHLEQALSRAIVPPGNLAPAGDHDLYALLADVCAQQRDLAGLRKYAPLAEETATRCGHTLYQAIAYRAWGVAGRLAGDYAQAEARLRRALELFSELDTRWQIGRTLFELGELAAARMDTAEARDYFSRALAAFEALQAAPDAVRTRKAMQTLESFS